MANMEKIIRPHLPANLTPPDKEPTCQVPPENTVVKLEVTPTVPMGLASAIANTSTSTYTYNARWYMTRREREVSRRGQGGGGGGGGGSVSTGEGVVNPPSEA